MTTKQIRLTIIIATVIILIAVFVTIRNKRKSNNSYIPSSGSSDVDYTQMDASFPLQYDSVGKQVVQLQRYLNDTSGASLTIDGIWGPKTDVAVEKACITTSLVTNCLSEISKEVFESKGMNKY